MSELEKIDGVPILIVTLARTEEESARVEFYMSPVVRILEDEFLLNFATALEGYVAKIRAGALLEDATLN